MKKVTHFTSLEKPWGKSHTPLRYIHPPFAEEIVTMWPNMTVMLGEIQGGAYPQKTVTGRITESALPSAAMAFLVRDKLLNPKNAEYKTRGDGIPIHTCVQNLGAFTLEAESFCNTERVTTAFTKLIVRNNTKNEYNGNIGLITRTGPEFDLLGVYEPDGYNELEPSVFRWMLLPQWKYDGGKITDGTYSVYMHIPQNVSVSFGEFFCNFTVALPPCAEAVLYFAFGRGEISSDFSYDDEKAKTEAFWEHELSKIKVFPKKDDSYFFAMYRSLVSQGLQMFCYPQGVNYALLRQGGLQRLVWPTENRCMIRALARIGDFGEYLEPIFNTYFHVMQANSGQIKNFGIPWSSVTGSVLYAFGAASVYHKDIYEKYKDDAYRAFLWAESQREISKKNSEYAFGLFPPDRASDYAAVGQVWGQTDCWNLQGYEWYLKGLETRHDPNAAQVKTAFEDYMACMKAVLKKAAEQQKDSDILDLPADARMVPEIEEVVVKGILSKCYELELLNLGVAGYDTDEARKILHHHFEINNEYENGLTTPYAPSAAAPDMGRRWYLSWWDSEMYYYCRRIGNDKTAEKILEAQLNYAMTDEYYMAERYDDHDPYFLPWCPNCSANGRTISMLCDWYIDRLNLVDADSEICCR